MQIKISIAEQRLTVSNDRDETLATFPVSTALKGAGEQKNSYCTPRGRHIIRAKIGRDAPINSVFRGRRPTGEIWTTELGAQYPGRDWILTRILWLSGCEPGFNRLGNVDTMQRYIYIHGTPDTETMGKPGSHGCIRMRNSDVMALFEQVPVGTPVLITDA
ncbi:MAG TPA: L,D-transpeptidase [Methylophilaceae bacterium]|nr:L,D-transpeptidase [Methylophilaceae bacterium]